MKQPTKRRRAPKGGCTCNGRHYRGGQFLPKAGAIELPGRTTGAPDLVTALAELAIVHTLAVEFPPDPRAATAQRRVHRGTATGRDARILDRRRRAAIAMLADTGPDPVRPYFRTLLAAFPAK